MQQSVLKLSLATCAVLSALSAHAQDSTVTVYGVISASLESVGASGGSGGNKSTTTRVTDNNSRIGFRGNEDLGNGVKAIWQVESSLRNFEQGGSTDWGQSATLATRNSFVGMSSEQYGRLIAGYNDTVYKSLVGSTADFGIDVMAGTIADSWGTGPGFYQLFSRGETRLKNSIHYVSPLLSGWQGGVSYGVDETKTNNTNRSRLSLAVKYGDGPFKAGFGWDRQFDTAGYEQTNSGTAAAGKHVDFAKLLAQWTFSSTGTLLGAGVERGTYESASGGQTLNQTGWTVGVSQPLSERLSLKASYSKLGSLNNASNADDYKATQWVLGATYAATKRTSFYTYATRLSNGALQNANFGFSPLTTGTNASSTVVLANGNTLHSVGVGMSTAF